MAHIRYTADDVLKHAWMNEGVKDVHLGHFKVRTLTLLLYLYSTAKNVYLHLYNICNKLASLQYCRVL
jgi:hypothetical protein